MQTTTKTIAQILLMDPSAYVETNLERYMRWCQNIANQKGVPLQSILANTAIANYYRTEINRLESEFLREATPIKGLVKFSTMRTMYSEKLVQIFTVYPSPLIEQAKKMKIVNQLYN